MMVLDISGSMNARLESGERRIDALEGSVEDFFENNDLGADMRSGLTAYNRSYRPQFTAILDYGSSHTIQQVNRLRTGNGTVPAEATEVAVDMLLDDRKPNETRREVMMIMTDGEVDNHLNRSGGPSFTERTIAACHRAKTEGIEVYAISFEAPDSGAAMLIDCASPNGHITNYDIETDETCQALHTGPSSNINSSSQIFQDCALAKSEYYFDISNVDEINASFNAIITPGETRQVRIIE